MRAIGLGLGLGCISWTRDGALLRASSRCRRGCLPSNARHATPHATNLQIQRQAKALAPHQAGHLSLPRASGGLGHVERWGADTRQPVRVSRRFLDSAWAGQTVSSSSSSSGDVDATARKGEARARQRGPKSYTVAGWSSRHHVDHHCLPRLFSWGAKRAARAGPGMNQFA